MPKQGFIRCNLIRALMGFAIILPSFAWALDCEQDRCALFRHQGYHRVIVGQIDGIGTEQDVRDFYDYGLARGYWPDMPKIERQALIDKTRLVWIRFGDGASPAQWKKMQQGAHQKMPHRIAVPMDLDEFQNFKLEVGYWVRYAPHNPNHASNDQTPVGLTVYNHVTGCVLFLCNQKHFDGCSKQYLSGVYRRDNGKSINYLNDSENKHFISIQPKLYTPII